MPITQEDVKKFVHIIPTDLVKQAVSWIEHRGGVLVWRSADLSRPDSVAISAAQDDTGRPVNRKPFYWTEPTPYEVITDARFIGVAYTEEVARFHVSLRQSDNGMTIKLTDASVQKLNKALARAGIGATYYFDHGTQEAVVLTTRKLVPLSELMG